MTDDDKLEARDDVQISVPAKFLPLITRRLEKLIDDRKRAVQAAIERRDEIREEDADRDHSEWARRYGGTIRRRINEKQALQALHDAFSEDVPWSKIPMPDRDSRGPLHDKVDLPPEDDE